MARGQKQTSSEKVNLLQSRIDEHKTQIANLEKRKSALQKKMQNEAVSELASFIDKKHLTISEVKRLINQSITKPITKSATKSATKSTTKLAKKPISKSTDRLITRSIPTTIDVSPTV